MGCCMGGGSPGLYDDLIDVSENTEVRDVGKLG